MLDGLGKQAAQHSGAESGGGRTPWGTKAAFQQPWTASAVRKLHCPAIRCSILAGLGWLLEALLTAGATRARHEVGTALAPEESMRCTARTRIQNGLHRGRQFADLTDSRSMPRWTPLRTSESTSPGWFFRASSTRNSARTGMPSGCRSGASGTRLGALRAREAQEGVPAHAGDSRGGRLEDDDGRGARGQRGARGGLSREERRFGLAPRGYWLWERPSRLTPRRPLAKNCAPSRACVAV